LRLLSRQDEERWVLPIDQRRERDEQPEPAPAALPYAIAAGLAATLLGVLVSIAVPGRGFLAVWALVTVSTSFAAGWEADRVRSAARRLLLNLSRTR